MNATDRALKPHAGGVISQWSETIKGEIRDDQGICLHNPDTDIFMKYHLAGAYDSNIALLLSTGTGRRESYDQMAEILRRTKLSGENLQTNIEFLYGLINWLIGTMSRLDQQPISSSHIDSGRTTSTISSNLDLQYATKP